MLHLRCLVSVMLFIARRIQTQVPCFERVRGAGNGVWKNVLFSVAETKHHDQGDRKESIYNLEAPVLRVHDHPGRQNGVS